MAANPVEIDNADTQAEHETSHAGWRALRLLNLYRLILAGLFVILAYTNTDLPAVGQFFPELFATTAVIYLIAAIGITFAIAWRRPDFTTQVYGQVLFDIAVITVVMHASGGIKSGLGMLLIVTVAAGSVLLAGQAAIRFAATAAIFTLGEHIYFQLTNPLQSTDYTHAGLLGAAFFATALLGHALAKRIRESEALAAQRGVDLANMEQLAQYVIQRMQTGVLVMDENERLWLVNESARHLLGLPTESQRLPLTQFCPPLAEQYHRWNNDEDFTPARFRPAQSVTEVLPRFAKLGDEGGTLIFLEDTATLSQQAQQLKLASLGRLAGSIAHEIRNPLGAISHAGQLLAESSHLDSGELRLTEIIRSNSQRMNHIIENVLQIGRRRQAKPEDIMLEPWLQDFIDEFSRSQQIDTAWITISVIPSSLSVHFDPSQLHQILWNLCHNAVRHSRNHSSHPQVEIRVGMQHDAPIPYLNVIDNGPGIDPETAEHIFEPFFTTETKGTGLGLYIARELSECNQAHLAYLPATSGGSCFRLIFADPRRRRVA
ncbi:MAG: ATPase [Gammaproteobacteria bacterium]|nr:ATPase [Gammaproteobacteria bacterium]